MNRQCNCSHPINCGRCPDYSPTTTNHICSICKYGIYSGDNYVKNENGDLAHYECFDTVREALEFAGLSIKEMREDEDR